MDEKVSHEAAVLTAASWQKAFRNDTELRKQVFRSLVAKLPDQLDEALVEHEEDLHPSQSVNVMEDRAGITLDDDDWMVRCYINPASPPALGLQFFKRGWTKESGTTVTVLLDCRGKDKYVWIAPKSEIIPSEELAAYVLRNLFAEGVQVVKDETPNLQA